MNKRKKIQLAILGGAIVLSSVIGFAVAKITSSQASPQVTETPQSTKAKVKEVKKKTTWTCSMHPQIKMKEKGSCPICGMDLIPLKKTESLGRRELRLSDYAVKLAEIQVQPVEKRDVYMNLQMLGKLNFDETRFKVVSARLGGRLDRLFIDYTGVPVKKGDHLFEIYSPELVTAQEELLQSIESAKEMQKSDLKIIRESSQQAISASREKLRLWGLKKAQIAQLEKSGKPLERVGIYSPISGVVTKKHLKEGAYVKEGSSVYTISDLSHLWLELEAYESDLAWLHFAQKVSFQTESYPSESFEGKISFIHPVLNAKTRTVKVRVNIENKDGRLKPDMFVRAKVKVKIGQQGQMIDSSLAGKWVSPMHPEIISDKPGDCTVCGMDLVPAEELGFTKKSSSETPLVVPASAVMITGKRAIVYIKSSKPGIYEGRVIQLGSRTENDYIVKAGLKEGELVVVNGNFKIDSSLQILAKPSMMSEVEKEDLENFDIPLSFKKSLSPIYDSYFAIGKDLSEDQYSNLKKHRQDIEKAFSSIASQGLNANAQEAWAKSSRQVILKTKHLSNSQSLDEARQRFQVLSGLMQNLLKQFGTAQKVNLAYCPMAFENKGAYWLQQEDKVANPYFGSSMYSCGDIKKSFGESSKAMPKEHDHSKMKMPEATSVSGKTADALLATYLKLQKSLSLDKKASGDEVTALQAQLKKQADAHKIISDELIKSLAHLHHKSLEQARVNFAKLSKIMIQLAGKGAFAKKTREAYCPMALNNRGASWLQLEEKVENPYFGSMMYRCGSIKKTYEGVKK